MRTSTNQGVCAGFPRQRGFTLVELMVALVLGLLVVGAAGSIFLSNRKVYGNTESINRIQENQRTAFELMARDIREAGGNPCTKNVVNMLDATKPGGSYFNGWQDGLTGTDGGLAPDTITLHLANAGSISVTSNSDPSANIGVSSATGLAVNDILMVCNGEMAAIFQATQINGSSGVGIQHNNGNGLPGNLQKPFQIDQATFDSNPSGNAKGYCFLPTNIDPTTGLSSNSNCLYPPSNSPAQVVKPFSVTWSIASNPRGGKSLYRQIIYNADPTTSPAPSEIAEGVTNLKATYKIGTSPNFVSATAVAANQWKLVTAVNVRLSFQAVAGALTSGDTRGTDNAVLSRNMADVITLRNHVDVQ